MARENYERWHSGIAAPSIKNIFPSVFLNYSHTSSGDSKESLCRTHYRQNCRYERKRRREWERLKWYEVFTTNTHEKKKVIGRESFLPLESFLPTPAIKPFVARWLEMVSYSAMRSFSIKLLTHSPLTIILSAFPFLITIPLVAIVHKKDTADRTSSRQYYIKIIDPWAEKRLELLEFAGHKFNLILECSLQYSNMS